MKRSAAFSMVEILLALVFVSFAFLPIYNLFRFGQRGTWNNEKEIESTNYASDLINFMRDRNASELDKVFKKSTKTLLLPDDNVIESEIQKIDKNLVPPPKVGQEYTRSMEVTWYNGNTGLISAIIGWLTKKRSVPNYLIKVTVKYNVKGQMMGDDEVSLFTIVMD